MMNDSFLLQNNNVASNPGLRSNTGFDATSGFCILRVSVNSVVNIWI